MSQIALVLSPYATEESRATSNESLAWLIDGKAMEHGATGSFGWKADIGRSPSVEPLITFAIALSHRTAEVADAAG